MPITSSSAAAVNSSRRPVRAMKRKTGRSRKRPASTMTSDRAQHHQGLRPAGQAGDPGLAVAVAAVGRRCRGGASSGSSASIGITAMSWNSSTANELWPPPVCSSPFSARVCSTMAVEERARIRPTASATRQARPSGQPHRPASAPR